MKLSKAFNISSGVRQGCVLASALFCLATDWFMFRYPGRLGVTLDEAVFTDLNYAADDAVLFAQDPRRWLPELKRFDDAATTIMGLHTSWVKTKLQNIGHAVTVHLLNQFPLMDTLWRSPISLSIWGALLTPLAIPVLIFFDDSVMYLL